MISERAKAIDASGIRRVFDLAAKLKEPINLSMGQPDFDAWPLVREAAIKAIESGKNKYLPTQGLPQLREKLGAQYKLDTLADPTDVFITAGVTGGLALSYLTLLDPGDEILIPDPFFVVYRDLATMLSAKPVYYDIYPDFKLRADVIEAAITPKTKAILVNSPGNPTGYACTQEELDAVIAVARKHDLFLLYDEIYDQFCYDRPHAFCLGKYEKCILLNGFSKSAGVPGWRLGFAIGPAEVIAQMYKLQQYSFVCANSIGQWAMLEALEVDFESTLQDYIKKRDFICDALQDRFSFVRPSGAFYLFPEAPGGNGQRFVERCIEHNLLVVPGSAFSRQDTHFRISFSAPLEQLQRGAEVLNKLAVE